MPTNASLDKVSILSHPLLVPVALQPQRLNPEQIFSVPYVSYLRTFSMHPEVPIAHFISYLSPISKLHLQLFPMVGDKTLIACKSAIHVSQPPTMRRDIR